LEKFYEKEIIDADRTLMEQGLDEILEEMVGYDHKNKHVSFLVIGDPYCATTHNDLFLRAV
jgi:diphthine synthase